MKKYWPYYIGVFFICLSISLGWYLHSKQHLSHRTIASSPSLFIIENVSIKGSTSYRSDEDLFSPWRKLDIDIDFQIKDSSSNAVLEKHRFQVVLSKTPHFTEWDSPEVKNVYPEAILGRFLTHSSITYNIDHPETIFRRFLIVKSLESPYTGDIESYEVFLNPYRWEDGGLQVLLD